MTTRANHRVLVVAAHPDDEVCGCGGTLAVHASRGDEVRVLVLGEGITSRQGEVNGEGALEALRAEGRVASKVLGVPRIDFSRFPDNRFDSVPLLEIVRDIESVGRDFQPTIVYSHHHGDVNVDHRRVADAVQAAFRPLPGTSVKQMLAFEVVSSTEWNFRHDGAFRPQRFVELTPMALQAKCDAMRAYVSELRPFPHPRSIQNLMNLAAIRGAQVGVPAAEAFALTFNRDVL